MRDARNAPHLNGFQLSAGAAEPPIVVLSESPFEAGNLNHGVTRSEQTSKHPEATKRGGADFRDHARFSHDTLYREFGLIVAAFPAAHLLARTRWERIAFSGG
jgi:hypothetical protein